MTMPVLKTETAAVAPAKLTADVVRFNAPKPSFVRARLVADARRGRGATLSRRWSC